jgi:hypothetical protein
MDLPVILKAIKKADLDDEGAMAIVSALRERKFIDFGITMSGLSKEKFIHFLTRFWDIDNSPYLKDKFAHGHRMTKKHCRTMCQITNRHWRPFFGETAAINSITREKLREFSIVQHDKGLVASTINNIMIAGTTALRP